MSLLKHVKIRLLITGILVCSGVASHASLPVYNLYQGPATAAKCDEIEVKLEITHTSANQRNGEILLEFKKSSASYTCFIFSGADSDNRLDVKDKKVTEIIETASEILQHNPFNGEQLKNIKKLVDVEKGDGQWRIRFGDYRIRYDVIGKDVALHSIKNRKDIYR